MLHLKRWNGAAWDELWTRPLEVGQLEATHLGFHGDEPILAWVEQGPVVNYHRLSIARPLQDAWISHEAPPSTALLKLQVADGMVRVLATMPTTEPQGELHAFERTLP